MKTEKKTEPAPAPSPATPSPAPSTPPKQPAPGGGNEQSLPTCCGSKGSCVPESFVPKDQRQYLTQKECAEQSLCAPTENLSPSFEPTACTGGPDKTTKGVCLSNCLELPFKQFLDQGTCDVDHTCAPCTNPITNEPTGAPGC